MEAVTSDHGLGCSNDTDGYLIIRNETDPERVWGTCSGDVFLDQYDTQSEKEAKDCWDVKGSSGDHEEWVFSFPVSLDGDLEKCFWEAPDA